MNDENEKILKSLEWHSNMKPPNNAYVLVRFVDGVITGANYNNHCNSFVPLYVNIEQGGYDNIYAPDDQPADCEHDIVFQEDVIAWAFMFDEK